MPTLTLLRDKVGNPARLALQCDYLDRERAKSVGNGTARWRPAEKLWTYPAEPLLVPALLSRFQGTLKLTQSAVDYLQVHAERRAEITTAVATIAPLGDDAGLWDFQRASVRFLEAAGKGILAHEMGTGKTVIVCQAIRYLGLERVLIVCPNSTKWSWVDHLIKWADWRRPLVMESGLTKTSFDHADIIKGDRSTREDTLLALAGTGQRLALIVNYDQLRMHQKVLQTMSFDVFVADEAHRLKNPKAHRTQVAQALAARAAKVWLLTGTPIRNAYTDYWALLNMCDPIRFSGFWNFVNIYMHHVPNRWGGVEVMGPRDPIEFAQVLSQYMFRKTKQEVLPNLPDKIHVEHKLPLNSRQETVYEKMEKAFLMEIRRHLASGGEWRDILVAPNTIAQLTRLRQICLTPALLGGVADSAKLDALRELLLEDLTGQIIVYSCFRQFLPYIAELLKEDPAITYAYLVGGQTAEERAQVERGLTSGSIQVVLGTIQSMGEGMNLQAAHTAIFCDIDWVPAVNVQAEDRIHRGEIKESPNIIRLYHPDTVDDHIRAVCARKEDMESATLGQVERARWGAQAVIHRMLERGEAARRT